MRQPSIGRLPGDDDLFDDHDHHYHPGIYPDGSFIVEVYHEPGHGPAEYPDGEEKLHRFYPGIYAEHDGFGSLRHDQSNYTADKIYPAEVVKGWIAMVELMEEVHRQKFLKIMPFCREKSTKNKKFICFRTNELFINK